MESQPVDLYFNEVSLFTLIKLRHFISLLLLLLIQTELVDDIAQDARPARLVAARAVNAHPCVGTYMLP